MTQNALGSILRVSEILRRRTPRIDDAEIKALIRNHLAVRDAYLSLAAEHGSPLYVLDTDQLREKARKFRNAFSRRIDNVNIFYAVKSNYHDLVLKTLVEEGIGLDASSGKELSLALDTDTTRMIFSGPGKRNDELDLAVEHSDKVTVLIDSVGELERLEELAAKHDKQIRAGARLTTDEKSIWRKFGIPLDSLDEFFARVEICRHVNLCGLQFHLSWNLSPEAQVLFIARLGAALRRFDKQRRDRIKFIDIGGGYWPEEGEWLQPAATPRGMLETALGDNAIKPLEHFKKEARSIDFFAEHLASAIEKHFSELQPLDLYLEPGRWLSNSSMHMLLQVIDRKAADLVITDGGTNAIGWDRYESDFCPVINLSRPGIEEHECLVAGSLCTPHDLWGYSYFGESIHQGDILLIPDQGAYTYCLRQEFIKPLPESVVMPSHFQPLNGTEIQDDITV